MAVLDYFSGLRKQYIFSFILVSIIPVFIIILLLYPPVINIFRDEMVKTDVKKSKVIRDIMDMRIQEMYNMSVMVLEMGLLLKI